MKSVRLLFSLVFGISCLALLSGCETQRSACEREKRLTQRMDDMQMELDGRIGGFNAEIVSLRANPPVVVQQIPSAPTPVYQDTIAIEDFSRRDELEALAAASRRQQLYAPPPPSRPASSASGNHIRVPVPARTVQTALREAGFYNGAIDGRVGPQTVGAITAFQRSQGITADGIVGRVTWQHLQAFVPAGMSTSRPK
ncbi:MAG: peptidoglycan-binding protein [Planctomycetes bacterium]|nr:peptidoglycan-binding protein [Planctomycetota bacterium]